MSVTGSSIGVRAMSLIELLCVMAIIAMLAALLLPAIGQAQARARRLQCIDHLHQVGVGFVSFAPSHCIVVEDALHGSDAARAAGMKSIGVTRNGKPLPADLATHSLAELAPNAFDNLLLS